MQLVKYKVKDRRWVSSPHDCPRQSTYYSVADLFNWVPSNLLWEVSSHAV